MKKSVDKSHWNNVYKQIQYKVKSEGHPIIELINKYIPEANDGEECFEIGCAPCTYLAYIGIKKKYIINGIDYTIELNERLRRWLSSLNLKVGEIQNENFFKICRKDVQKYDFVYSLGFIEHFKEFEKVIRLHDLLVKKNGYLVITTPNYSGKVNYILRRFFNYNNLKIHYLPSMNPKKWSEILREMGYEILYTGYFGGFEYEIDSIALNWYKRLVWNCLVPFIKLANKRLTKENKNYSKFCGIVAVKR